MKSNIYVLLLGFFALTFAACDKEVNPDAKIEQPIVYAEGIYMDKPSVSLWPDEQIWVQAIFEEGAVPEKDYGWYSSDEEVVSAEGRNNHSALLTAKKTGSAVVSYRSGDGELSGTCTVEVATDGVIRILAIGNSFSEDAIEHYLHGLAEASGIPVIIGNLSVGEGNLSQHAQNATDDISAYSYRKINVEGTKTTRANTSLSYALADERWDYVSFQQMSSESGLYHTYVDPLPVLYNYIKNQLKRPSVQYVLHQTWAYAQNSTLSGFANYGGDQLTMYGALVDVVNRASQLVDIDVIVPAGTAIQNGRTSVVGDNFTRGDGSNLDLYIGRYTASCTWYEAIFGQSVVGNTFKPAALLDVEAELAQQAAHLALLNPNGITVMTDYQRWPGAGEFVVPAFIDFNQSTSQEGWNGFTSHLAPYTLRNITDKDGNNTYVSIELMSRFASYSTNGEPSTETEFNMPEAVSKGFLYGNTTWPKVVLKVSGLLVDKQYEFCFFCSQKAQAVERWTNYKVIGQSDVTVSLNASKNTENIVCTPHIQPDANGEIFIELTAGTSNNAAPFFAINAMRISMAD